MLEKFSIYLDSTKADSGATTPHQCTFNVGDIYNFAPNAQKYAERDYCYVKVSNFSIKYTASQANTDGVSNVLVTLNTALPNSATNTETGNGTLAQSGIIATVPTGASDYSYSNVDYDNDMIKSSNILKGQLVVTLLDQLVGDISADIGSSNPWQLLLCVYYESEYN